MRLTTRSLARTVRAAAPGTVSSGLLAALLSGAALAWRGQRETGSAAAPVNAIAHWFWPRTAFKEDGVTMRYSGTGLTTHVLSSLFWSGIYTLARRARRRPTPANAVADAAAITAVAAAVDLVVVPKRLSPGFEERLSPRGLTWVYVAFGTGLAVAGWVAARRS
ncbi:MAG: hypothetical protein IPM15_09835 [Betaproteobacteria bacterium]|nr:hypothetical protein [Betaproteobacteria bacterium]MCC6247321.1 hypothetical protein [Rubrivivax sp.]MCL4700087.1 hypothetical protein [Burkholderiaceae bacterium]